MLKVHNGNYYQQKLQNNYFQPKVLLLAQPLGWSLSWVSSVLLSLPGRAVRDQDSGPNTCTFFPVSGAFSMVWCAVGVSNLHTVTNLYDTSTIMD